MGDIVWGGRIIRTVCLWKQPFIVSITMEARIYEPGELHKVGDVSWEDRYGTLPPGHYRLVKSFWPDIEGGKIFLLSGEFEIE